MKTTIYFILIAIVFTSCYETVVETRYDPRDRVAGRYEVEEFSNSYGEYVYYNMYVSKDMSSRGVVYLDDFYLENMRVYAVVNGDHIDIPFQIVDGYEIEGSGYEHRGELHLNYTISDRYDHNHAEYFEAVAYPF